MKEALVLCARSDPKWGDRVSENAHRLGVRRKCAGCHEEILVSPSSLTMESADLRLILKCNPCGNADAANRGTKALGIAPGALPPTTPENRRRRNTLEAHGFKDVDPNEL